MFFALLLVACAPAVKRSDTGFPILVGAIWNLRLETTKAVTLDFSLDGTPITDRTSWVYANLKSSTAGVAGMAAIPSDQKNLVLVFALDPKRVSQVSCIVPRNADFSRAVQGLGALYNNDRKTSEARCTLNQKR